MERSCLSFPYHTVDTAHSMHADTSVQLKKISEIEDNANPKSSRGTRL